MKIARITVALSFVCAAALAQSEGVAEFKGSMGGGSGQSIPSSNKVYFKKDVAIRSEMEMDLTSVAREDRGGSRGMMPSHYRMVMIQKLSEPDRMVTINEDTKSYSVMDLKKTREGTPENTATYTVKKFGRDTVAGHACEKALVTSSTGSEIELCVSNELGSSAAWLAAQSRRERSANMLNALREAGLSGFPIRWVIRDKKEQKVIGQMELVRLDWKSVPASMFEVPAGYRETSTMESRMTPEQQKAMKDALDQMTPEQRKMYEEMMKKKQQ